MDKDKLIDLLNEDLATEFQSLVQYVQHIATVTGPEYQSTVEELRAHLGEELNHAIVLTEQITFLGGVPSARVPEVETELDSRRALELDLRLEEHQLDRYRERVAQTNELGLPDVGEALRPLLQQTQDHVRDLQAALGG